MKDVEFLKHNGIDVDHSVELLGDIEMVSETMADFLTECDERLPLMEQYKNESDMENYAILVHALKSDSKYLGFTALAELAYQHEMESKAGNRDYIDQHYGQLIQETTRVIDIVKQYLGK